jgi:hypothetical protein
VASPASHDSPSATPNGRSRHILGHEAHAVADPYWLPDALVQIDVEADGSEFIVSIGSSSI